MWAGEMGHAVCVSRGLQEGNHQPELRTVNLLRDCTFLALGWGQNAARCPHTDTTLPLCPNQERIRAPSSCSGPLVPSTEKALYVDCKGGFHSLLRNRY